MRGDQAELFSEIPPLPDRREVSNERDRARRHDPAEAFKHAARLKLRWAVLKGDLVRPDRCESCGAARQLDGHHEDYSRPLDVEWLCRVCHRRRHCPPDVLPGQLPLPMDDGGGE